MTTQTSYEDNSVRTFKAQIYFKDEVSCESDAYFADGSAADPSIAFLNSDTTGLYSTTNVIGFTASGTSQMTIANGTITISANFVPSADNTYDIGTTGARPKTIYAGTSIAVGTANPSAKAILDLTSTTKGFLPPRMTSVQRLAITSPPVGLMVYDTTLNMFMGYGSDGWQYMSTGCEESQA